mmetsp:Transcript_30576/g.46920  ORF Transcript_30576/g.46920 Transcript_30576/m.46920 type:complete len:138 (+) Transcript_30576:155-568(+)|eukprot:CAMPEP_0195299982 /NCGR_PEP_ID=MMETSP0707-20130614/26536_1 /TAXON_ID=33640 /ORGANISM="Asterionellopsis glacialis, Strain CCMP134" /LENGTH=137 /DNA_ID=CAMNT_0040362531 /DNA_START=144 /DNA_END=557 /DNA_ORIENTATION=-
MTRLTKVFFVHRFIAGGFGVSLLLAPQVINDAFDVDRELPLGERHALQSWGCFIIAVACIVHAARTFPVNAQRSIGWSLLVCFVLLDVLYGHALLTEEMEETYKHGFTATGVVFVALTFAYAWGIAEKASTHDGKQA